MKIKTAELTGPALDWAVAKAEGFLEPMHDEPRPRVVVRSDAWQSWVLFNPEDYGHSAPEDFDPSTNWAQGGPIIEREKISMEFLYGAGDAGADVWIATRQENPGFSEETGPTALVAAMRCYVAAQLGDRIDVPDELLPQSAALCEYCGSDEPPRPEPKIEGAYYCPNCKGVI